MAARTGLLDQLRDPPNFWRRDPDTVGGPTLPAIVERSAPPVLRFVLPLLIAAPVPVFLLMLFLPVEPGAPPLFQAIIAENPEFLVAIAVVLVTDAGLVPWMLFLAMRVRRYTVDRLQVNCESRGPFGRRQWQEPLSRYTGLVLEHMRLKGGSLYIVRLDHPRFDRRVPLVVTRSEDTARRQLAAWVSALKLPVEEVA